MKRSITCASAASASILRMDRAEESPLRLWRRPPVHRFQHHRHRCRRGPLPHLVHPFRRHPRKAQLRHPARHHQRTRSSRCARGNASSSAAATIFPAGSSAPPCKWPTRSSPSRRNRRPTCCASSTFPPSASTSFTTASTPANTGAPRKEAALRRYGIDPAAPFVLFVGPHRAAKRNHPSRQRHPVHGPRLPGRPLRRRARYAGDRRGNEGRRRRRPGPSARGHLGSRDGRTRPSVIQLYSHAAAFCCPSIYEPFGIINLEAMACETPVVASAVGGIKEVVVDGETGFLVPLDQLNESPFEPVDPGQFARDLAAKINLLMSDADLRARFRQSRPPPRRGIVFMESDRRPKRETFTCHSSRKNEDKFEMTGRNSKFEIRNSKDLARSARTDFSVGSFHLPPRHPRCRPFEFRISNFEFSNHVR